MSDFGVYFRAPIIFQISEYTTMAAARADPTGAPIEALFRPTTRLQDLYDIRRDLPEVELLPHLTPPDVLATSHICSRPT
jgi:hypothetical protein